MLLHKHPYALIPLITASTADSGISNHKMKIKNMSEIISTGECKVLRIVLPIGLDGD